jgi:hypothetical protein
VKVVIITSSFELEVRPTSKVSLDAVKAFVQALTQDPAGDKRGPGRPKKNGEVVQPPTLASSGEQFDDEIVNIVP